jgi:hypothetical protein
MSAINSKDIYYDILFRLYDPFANRPLRLSPRDQNWLHSEQIDLLFKGEWQPPEPIVLRASTGEELKDFLWTDYPPIVCISDRVKDLLLNNQFTGWSIYPVTVYDREGNQLFNYSGFSVKSSVGNLEIDRSPIINKLPVVIGGQPWKVYKGMFFNEKKWDGSNIFRIEKSFIIITRDVQIIFKHAKVTNIKLQTLSEVELNTAIFDVKKHK